MKIKLLNIGIVALLLTACGQSTPPSADATVDEGDQTIKIATESSFKPFSYLDNQGNLVGFEIDLANAICTQMKATCEISSQDWDSLIPSLNMGKFDAVMAGMSATEERQQVVDFSDPYFNNTLVLIGKKEDSSTINDIDGKKVATQQATTSSQYLTDNYPKAQVLSYDTQDNAYTDLVLGRTDLMLSDYVPANDWLKTDAGSGFEIKGEPIDIGDFVAVAIKKDNTEILTKFNDALSVLKQNGEYDKLVAKYFDDKQD